MTDVLEKPSPARLADGSWNPAYTKYYYETHKSQYIAKSVSYRRRNLGSVRAQCHKRNQERKIRVLTHYGKDGKLQCCWTNCKVRDVDMLTLDHVENDGSEHRKINQISDQCFWIEKSNYPKGFQTLCWNHQWKKELTRRRESYRAQPSGS